MKMESVFDPSFREYGTVLEGYDFSAFLPALRKTDCPPDRVVYVAAEPTLEELPVAEELRDRLYGGMPIQVGYCNGSNGALNCLEYHRGSEVNICATDAVLLVAQYSQVRDGTLDTGLIKAYFVPAGTAVRLYETTLHYAPCSTGADTTFQVAIVLLQGTNTNGPEKQVTAAPKNGEDRLLWAKNKWLLVHPESAEASQGAHVGLVGENLRVW